MTKENNKERAKEREEEDGTDGEGERQVHKKYSNWLTFRLAKKV